MKKFDTFQTFARGAKSLVAILLVMLMAVGGLFAQTTYNFSDYSSGDQYAEEEHVLDGVLTIYTVECHFRNDGLRIYSSDAHNGYFYSNALPNNIDSISFNIGNATDKLLVYGSADGMTWTLIGSVASVSTYSNQGIGFGDNEYNYFKCDVEGSNQLRIKSFTMFYKTTPTVEIPTWVTEDQVAIFNTQVNGLVPTFSVNDNNESVFHFAYTDAFQGYPAQNPSTEMGANPSKVYVDMMIKRPNADITGVKVSYGEGHDTIINFTEVTDPYNGTLGDPYDAILHYFPVATVFTDGTTVGNPIDRSWTVDVEWCIGTNVVDTQYVIVKVDAAPGDNWVTCEQVDVFNTQVDGLVPTCSTVGDSTVFHFSYNENFEGFPAQTPSEEMGGNPSKVYVDVMIMRPNEDITGVKVSYGEGRDTIINFTEVTDPFNGTLGDPYDAILHYFPVATVNPDGSVTGNTVDRNWTVDVEWYLNKSVVFIQKLNVKVDAAPAPVLPYDTVAELPYVNNFDEGIDPYFVIENGTATNKWYTGQVEGFENNKLYISSNGGTTNKYDINKASNVIAYRDVMVPETGAVLSFDYRVNGEGSSTMYDYLKVELEKEGTSSIEVAMLNLQNEWSSFNYNIPAEMAGVVRIVFAWFNDGSVGNQFPAAIDNISVIETPCVQPANLVATVDTTTATITWEAVEGQTAWNFEYKLADHTDWYTMAVTDTTVTLTDLQGNSNYDMRVQTDCGEFTSEWTTGTFEVACQHEEEGNCEDQPSCPDPSELVVENVTFNGAELNWIAGDENQTAFIVEYMAEGDAEWTSVEVNDTTYTLTELAQLTNYTVRVKANCGEYNLSEAITANFTTKGMCPNITNLQYSNISNTTTLTWEAGGEESNWQVQFKPASAGEDEWISIDVAVVPMTTFGGLQGNTEYVARVKAMCDLEDEENQSEWVTLSFTSGCSPYDVPFTETFGSLSLPTCWDGEGFDFYSGGYTRSYHENDYLITPPINIPTENTSYLSFEISGSSSYTVLASYRGTRADRFEVIYTGTATSTTEKVIVPIDNLYRGRATNFKIVNNGSNLRINEVRVNQCPFTPTNLTVDSIKNIGDVYYATINWTAPEGIETFQLAIESQLFEIPGEDYYLGNNQYSVTFWGFQYGATYQFRVRTVCEGDDSEWAGPVSATIEIAYNIADQATITTCAATLYDNGGANGNYSSSANDYVTIYPNSENSVIHLEGEYNIETNVAMTWDYIIIYDGTSADAPQLLKTSGTGVLDVTATNHSGALTVYFHSDGSTNYSGFALNISCVEAPTCSDPQNLAFNETTSTLTWSAGDWGTPTAYNIRYGIEGENTYEETTTTDTSVVLSGLLSNTAYVFMVQAVCGEDNSEWSESITATTPCLPLSLPYVEDFENYTIPSYYYYEGVMPECWTDNWTAVATSSSSHYEPKVTNYSSYNPGSSKYLFMHAGSSSSTNTSYQNPTIVILPAFNADLNAAMISFRARSYNASNGTLYLGYVNDENVFTELTSVTCATNNSAPLQTFMLDQYTIPAGAKLAFKAQNTASTSYATYMIGIDDIAVKLIPTCGEPSVVVNRGIATISPNSIGTPSSYTLQIGEEIATVDAEAEGPTTVDLNNLFNIVLGEEYDVQVWTSCEDGTSEEVSVHFKYEISYTIDEASSITTCNATLYDTGGADGQYGNSENYTVVIYPETSNALIHLQGEYNTEANWDWIYVYDGVGTTGTQLAKVSGVSTLDFTSSDATGALTVKFTSDGSGTRDGFVFNITCEIVPTCATPSVEVNKGIATITPGSFGTTSSYTLQIGDETVVVEAEAEGPTTVNLPDSFTLVLGEEYDIEVITNCAEGTSEPALAHFKYEIAYKIDGQSEITTCNATLYDDGGADGNYSNSKTYTVTIYPETSNALIHLQGNYDFEISSYGTMYDYVIVYDGTSTSAEQIGKFGGEGTLDITATNTSGALTVYFYSDGSTNKSGFAFNITCEVAPTCFAPENLTATEISDNSAVLTWSANSNNPDTVTYVVEYMAEGDADWQTATVNELTYALSNLTASTNYMVRVKTDCGDDDESEYAEASFTTLCLHGYYEGTQVICPEAEDLQATAINSFVDACEIDGKVTITVKNFGYEPVTVFTAFYQLNDQQVVRETVELTTPLAMTEETTYAFNNLPVFESGVNTINAWVKIGDVTENDGIIYSEDFEEETTDMIFIDNDGDGNNWYNSEYDSESRSHNGAYSIVSASYINYFGELTPDNWMITPVVAIPAEGANLSWWVAAKDPAWPAEHYQVMVSTTGMNTSDFTSVFEETLTTNEWLERTVSLAAYAGQNIHIAFVHNNSSDMYQMSIDDIAVTNVDASPVAIVTTSATVLEPETVPYTPDFYGMTINHGWNPIDANNDGITMNLNNNINYTYNDELAADDWMMSPCIEMPAGVYTVSYDYKANSAMTESFEVYYGNGAHIADMTNALAAHTFNNTIAETVTHTITIAEAGVYNFGFHATSLAGNMGFSIENFEIYPVIDVEVLAAENGTVTPNGIVAVNYGKNLTLSLVPDPMYHVAGVWVDSVQVVPEDGTGANFMLYTLENVTEPHTVFVDFKLEFHIIKSVENYRPDLYADFGGAFEPAATDTTINPDPFTVKMVADPHYFLNSLSMSMVTPNDMQDVTLDVVDNGDGTYNYTIDTLVVANYYLNAVFRRDTVDINYNVLTGKGYAHDSQLLDATDADNNSYTTWVDYSVNHDVDTTVTFTAGDNYHIVDVIVNGESQGRIDSYTFEDVTESQNVDIKFGYRIDAFVSNYNTYDSITDIMGTITPDTQYVAEYDPMLVIGTVEEHFHLYQFFVNGEDRISEVVFGSDPHYYYFTMDSIADNYTIEAVVKVDTFAITYNVLAGQGYADASGLLVEGDSYSTIVNYADNWYSNIEPATGYSIANVTLDGTNLYTANNYQFNYIEESHVFDVTFVANTYTVATNAYGNGTVSDGISFTYDPENAVDYEFTATPAEGYYIASVTINNEAMEITDVDNFTYTIENVADNYTINVIFQMYTYTMTATVNPTSTLEGDVYGGTITPSGTQTVNYGADVTYTINANEGWYIYYVTVDGVNTNYTQADGLNTLDVPFTNINDNHEVEVGFLRYKYDITAAIDGDVHGAINEFFTSLTEVVYYGENFSMTFDADNNYQVADVVIDGEDMGAITSYEFVNVTANHTVVVSFEAIMYTLTATSNVDACAITPATTTVQAGSDVNYTLTVANGYHLENVIANGEEVVVTSNAFTISNVQSDYTIYANFASNYVTVTVDQPEHATITPGTQTFAYGATPSYMIVPEVGYDIVSVTAGNAVVNVTYNNGIGSFTLDPVHADITLTATTAKKQFTITVATPTNGVISPAATQTVEYGDNITFTITPNQYYTISDVIVDGSSRGQLSSYTFYNVTSNHSIAAEFESACYMPTNLTAFNIDTTSAELTWVGNAPSYEVRYKAADDAAYTVQTVNTNSVQLTGLTPGTLYAWGVRAICGSNLSSEWAINGFTTKNSLPSSISSTDMSSINVYSYLNNVYIVNEEGIAISNVDIYDIYGKQVYTGKVLNSPEVISLNVANGNYVVRLATENGVGVYKVVIVR